MTPTRPGETVYDALRRDFRLEVPERFNFVTDVFEAWARRDPQRVALVVADAHGEHFERRTFADLSAEANRFALALLRLGLVKGDRVLVMLPRIAQWHAALLAMFKVGILPVPTTAQCTARDCLHRIERAGATAVITDAPNAAKFHGPGFGEPDSPLRLRILVEAAAPGAVPAGWLSYERLCADESDSLDLSEKTRSDDPMLLYFTSGTVAYPKMVLHTQASYGIAHQITACFWQNLRPDDLHWTVTDTGWAKAAWGCLFGQWTIGARVFMHNSPRFETRTTLDLLERAGITTFCAPPTVYRLLVHEDLSGRCFPTLRHCTSAGEPLNPEVIKLWHEATGLQIRDGYGQTETVNVLASLPSQPLRPGSMGRPTPGYEVALLDDDLGEVPVGQEGQIAIRVRPERPVGLFAGYWGQSAEGDGSPFRGDWYLTGDKARMDEDGYFWFIGRCDDVIITSGYRVGPFEVENALVEHPAVLEAAAVSSPDPDRGEVVKAFVILAPGHQPGDELVSELQRHVRETTAPYKYPRRIEFVDALPKTISGKIRRGVLKEREWGGHEHTI